MSLLLLPTTQLVQTHPHLALFRIVLLSICVGAVNFAAAYLFVILACQAGASDLFQRTLIILSLLYDVQYLLFSAMRDIKDDDLSNKMIILINTNIYIVFSTCFIIANHDAGIAIMLFALALGPYIVFIIICAITHYKL